MPIQNNTINSAKNSFHKETFFTQPKQILQSITYQYNAISDGLKRIYLNEDEIKEYGNQGILDPNTVSYYNVFINGVLQPENTYILEKGKLTLLTEDIPVEGSSIIISFISIGHKNQSNSKLNSAEATASTICNNISAGPISDEGISPSDNPYYLFIEKNIISGPKNTFTGLIDTWTIDITLTNISNININNIDFKTEILLDNIIELDYIPISGIPIIVDNNLITATINTLTPDESISITLTLKGYFKINGINYLSKSLAMGQSDIGFISSYLVASEKIQVNNGLSLSNFILSGPLKTIVNMKETWTIEINIFNETSLPLNNIIVENNVFLDEIMNFKRVHVTEGFVTIKENNINWIIDTLNPKENLSLIIELTGSFSNIGSEFILSSMASGLLSNQNIYSNLAKDFKVTILENQIPYNLELTTEILNNPPVGFMNISKTWKIKINLQNKSNNLLENIKINSFIFFDNIENIILFPNTNQYSFENNILIINIDSLNPQEIITLHLDVIGYFNSIGIKPIIRSIATFDILESCDFSNISFGGLATILDYRKDLSINCIRVPKILSHYGNKTCINNFSFFIDFDEYDYLSFKNGFIVKDSIVISDIPFKDSFKRIKFVMRIPFEVVLKNKKYITGFLPDIYQDLIMYIPNMRDELSFNINIDTISTLLQKPYIIDKHIVFTTGVFINIKAMSTVDLCVPSFEILPFVNECKYVDNTTLNLFYKKDFPEFFPGKPKYINPPKSFCLENNINLSKHIISGPIYVYSNIDSQWIVEINIKNTGTSPIFNIALEDLITLDVINNINIISNSHGVASIIENKILWNINTLTVGTSAKMMILVDGYFYNSSISPYKGETFQFNTISNGIKKTFTNSDAIIMYPLSTIPNPENVSFFNLFINGVLQPAVNYTVQEGLLTLNIDEPPIANVPIVLEYVVLKDMYDTLLKAETYQYNTLGTDKSIYTNADELIIYGNQGILNPDYISYENLFVNGVLQPNINYMVTEGELFINTDPLPTNDVPISLNFVTFID